MPTWLHEGLALGFFFPLRKNQSYLQNCNTKKQKTLNKKLNKKYINRSFPPHPTPLSPNQFGTPPLPPPTLASVSAGFFSHVFSFFSYRCCAAHSYPLLNALSQRPCHQQQSLPQLCPVAHPFWRHLKLPLATTGAPPCVFIQDPPPLLPHHIPEKPFKCKPNITSLSELEQLLPHSMCWLWIYTKSCAEEVSKVIKWEHNIISGKRGAIKPKIFGEILSVFLSKTFPRSLKWKTYRRKKNNNFMLLLHFVLLAGIPWVNTKYSAYHFSSYSTWFA